MKVCCLDLEGVLVPEIWIEVARRFKVAELRLTTRDIPDYDSLMRKRIGILKKKGIRFRDIEHVIAGIKPLPGAKAFLETLRRRSTVVILSDTFYQFAGPLIQKLGQPALFCNELQINKAGFIAGYHLRQKDGKTKSVKALRSLGFRVYAAGDSFNDLGMLKAAHRGILFNPPASIRRKFKRFPTTARYSKLLRLLLE